VDDTLTRKIPAPFPPPPPLMLQKTTSAPWGAAFPLFGRFRRDTGVDHLAGTRPIPPILRPVQLTLVPNKVESFHDVAVALRQVGGVLRLWLTALAPRPASARTRARCWTTKRT
jgi:hypothetical protein